LNNHYSWIIAIQKLWSQKKMNMHVHKIN